jgi:ABC-type nitrate/sulfonate/bicarbonate transport system permease component
MSGQISLPRQASPAPTDPRAVVPVLRHLLLQFSLIILLLSVWLVAGRLQLVRPFLLPPLPDVVSRFVSDIASGAFFLNAGLTLYRAVVGFALACAIGVPLGILIALVGTMRWFWEPLISVGFPMPKIAFLPIFMLWFGLYDISKIIMVAFAAVFTVVAAAEAGTRGVDKILVWSARGMGASRFAIFHEVILPAALPQILTGLQVALPISLITTVVTEMLMGGAGLGGMMMQAGSYADSVGVYAGIVETTVVGSIAVTAMAQLRRRLLRWHAEFNPR